MYLKLIARNANTTRNKQQQKFCEFVKPLIERISELQLKANDFEQLKVIGRGAFGQVALVKVCNPFTLLFVHKSNEYKFRQKIMEMFMR